MIESGITDLPLLESFKPVYGRLDKNDSPVRKTGVCLRRITWRLPHPSDKALYVFEYIQWVEVSAVDVEVLGIRQLGRVRVRGRRGLRGIYRGRPIGQRKNGIDNSSHALMVGD